MGDLIGRACLLSVPHEFFGYRYESIIGRGSFAIVALVTRMSDGQQFACKVISQEYLIEKKLVESFKREVENIGKLNHPNILQLVDFLSDEKLIYMIMTLCPAGDLHGYIAEHGAFPEYQAKAIFKQIVSAVDYLHTMNIAHRDLKPENILLEKDMTVKLADFGFSKETTGNQLMKTKCGSPIYTAPEIITQPEYDGKMADMWSLGVILFVMLTGKVPWESVTNETQLFFQIRTARYHIPENINRLAAKLIGELMTPQPEMRCTAKEVLTHPWLQENSRNYCASHVIQNRRTLLQESGRQSVRVIQKRIGASMRMKDPPLTRRVQTHEPEPLL